MKTCTAQVSFDYNSIPGIFHTNHSLKYFCDVIKDIYGGSLQISRCKI